MRLKTKLALGSIIIGSALLISFLFARVKQIDCRLKNDQEITVCPDQLTQSILKESYHQPLLFFDLKNNLTTSKTLFGRYRVVDLKKTWPFTVSLLLKPDQLVYQVKLDDQLLSISSLGIANQSKTLKNLPVVETKEDLKDLLKQNHQALSKLSQELKRLNLYPAVIHPKPNLTAEVELPGLQSKLRVSLKKNQPTLGLEAVLNSTQFAKLKQTGQNMVIDLRFKLPVLYRE